jgi:hypothetical protein
MTMMFADGNDDSAVISRLRIVTALTDDAGIVAACLTTLSNCACTVLVTIEGAIELDHSTNNAAARRSLHSARTVSPCIRQALRADVTDAVNNAADVDVGVTCASRGDVGGD